MSKQKQKKVEFIVSLPLPEGATIRGARNYIAEAVTDWRSQLRPPRAYDSVDPGDPMYSLDVDHVRVRHLRRSPSDLLKHGTFKRGRRR